MIPWPPQGHDGDNLVIVAGPDGKFRAAGLTNASNFDNVSAGLFHAAEIGMVGQGLVNGHGDVDSGAGWDVVNDAGKVNLVPNGGVVGDEPRFCGFVVIGTDQEQAVAPSFSASLLRVMAWVVALEPVPAITLQRPRT